MTANGQADLRMPPPDSGDDEHASRPMAPIPFYDQLGTLWAGAKISEVHEMRIVPVVGYDSIVYCICGWCEHIDVYTGPRTAASTYVSDQPERITAAYRTHLEDTP